MYDEDDLLQLAGLQHLAFCERQWGLIHLESAWTANPLTVEGDSLHQKVHDDVTEVKEGVRIARGLRLRSLRLGLSGMADVVEFHPVEDGVRLPGRRGRWKVFPVEYKRGKPKADVCDEIQVCAQAMCLEEMLGAAIPEAALFYGRTRRRHEVTLDGAIRSQTEVLAARMHELFAAGRTPPAAWEAKCKSCSMLPVCMPKTGRRSRSVPAFTAAEIRRVLADTATGGDDP